MIDVLVPVLDRPQNVAPLVESFLATSSPLDEITFICSKRDRAQIQACRASGQRVLVLPEESGFADYAKKMNYGYANTERDFLFLGSDDITFTPCWSEAALQVMGDTRCVVATNDQLNSAVKRGQFGTHCLVRRSYVDDPGASCDGPGFIIHPGYDHNFVDRELCHLAESRGVYGFAKGSIVRHRHHLGRTAPFDATYEKGQRNFRQDQALFLRRAHLWGYVGLKPYERNLARRRERDILRARR